MGKIEYKIEKDNDFVGKRCNSYSIEKIITKENGKIEVLYATVSLNVGENINEIDLDKVYFNKPITCKEFKQLSKLYQTAWLSGTMTKELQKELEELRLKESVA